ncbi:endo alpha-1,4 polygalactosaminidase [Nocardioides litoris]|uniref:endo alpha-1,4 polygalactosaminidase n=1 Tax=Nocardioides litoris TaxID=1926648 RepID=UPI001122A3BB|nr:endo alpha-1,4 polygalactosaminidase [Nocardioides litoris]
MRRPFLCLLVLTLAAVLLGPAGPARAAVRPLPVGTEADYQLGGPDAVPPGVGIVVRDRTARPAGAAYDVCYVNGFQTQPDAKRFWRARWGLVLQEDGRPVVDEAWGEWLLDLRTPRKRQRLAAIVGRWVQGCARSGFDAVEYDNLDSFTRSGGLLDREDAIAFAQLLVHAAHRAGLAAGQKNLAGYDGTRIGFDFAVAESCAQYDECGRYVRHYGRRVVMVEYRAVDFRRGCARWGATHPVVLRDLDLAPSYTPRSC